MATTVYNTHTNYGDLHAAGLERDGIAFKIWAHTLNYARFNTLLSILSRNNAVRNKKFEYPIGDIPAVSGTLTSDTVIPAAGNTVNIPASSEIQYLQAGDTLRIIDTADGKEALVRLMSTASGGTYANAVVLSNTNAGATYASASSSVHVVLDVQNYDGEAPQSIDALPSKLYNVMQRTRQAFGKGKWAMTGDFVHDNSLTQLQRVMLQKYAKQETLAMVLNPEPIEATSTNDFGVAAGFEYFLNFRNSSSNPGPGVNVVRPTTVTFDYSFISSYFAEFTKGSETKWVVAPPTVIQKFMAVFRDITAITNTEFKVVNEDNMWMGAKFLTVELSTRKIVLIPDESLRGVPIYANDGTNTYTGDSWALIVDPNYAKKVFLDVDSEGVQTPHVLPIQQTRNSSLQEYEITSTWSLVIDDPETHGLIANI